MTPGKVFLLAAVCSCWSGISGGRLNLTIMHTNDVHARFDETNAYGARCPEEDAQQGKCYGGVARLKTKVEEIRRQYKNTLFLNAGDFYQGTLYFNEFSYNITADFTNRLGYDAVSLGNHEFDLGVQGLIPYIDRVHFPVMACNVNLTLEPGLNGKVKCQKVFVFDNEKVAVVGFVTPETADLSTPGKVIFLDEVEVLQKVVQSLKGQGVNKIIAVGHSGYAVEIEIARRVKGLDIVVGGHTNTFLYTGIPPTLHEEVVGPYPTVVTQEDGSKVLVVQDYAYAKYLGFLNVRFDEEGKVESWSGNPILLNSSVEMDPETLSALQPYKQVVEAKGSEVVGQTRVLLRGDRLHCRLRECNLGNLMADANVRYYAKGQSVGWTKYSIALFNSGGIRASIFEHVSEGNVTRGDVLTVFPFSNTADLAGLYGRHLREAMEWSVHKYDLQNPAGAFLQVSGLKVSYDICRPPGKRVVELKALCSRCRVPVYEDVKDDKEYYMVVPTFVLNGGDGYKVIKENAFNVSIAGVVDVDVFLEELRRSSPVISGEEERITFVGEGAECKNRASAVCSICAPVLLLFSLFVFTRTRNSASYVT